MFAGKARTSTSANTRRQSFFSQQRHFSFGGSPLSRPPCALAWLCLAPPGVEVFCWLASAGRVTTTNVPSWRVIHSDNISTSCVTCGGEEKQSLSKLSCALAWLGLAPPQGEAFCWLAITGRVSTATFLRRGIHLDNISTFYVMCGRELTIFYSIESL